VEGRHFWLPSCGEGRDCCDGLSWGLVSEFCEMDIQNLSFVGLALDVQSCR
jgi:hypothetical protein